MGGVVVSRASLASGGGWRKLRGREGERGRVGEGRRGRGREGERKVKHSRGGEESVHTTSCGMIPHEVA